MNRHRPTLWLSLLLFACALFVPAARAAQPTPVLPEFAGWQKISSAVATHSGWSLPANEAPIMTEFGLLSVERDVYQRGDRKIQVEGQRYADAGGAYGAFTYYRPLNYSPFYLGKSHEQAVSGDTHILFTRGVWLIRVTMDQLTAMTASEMRQLATNLTPTAGISNLPTLPYYFPRKGLLVNSIHYAEGPAGFAAACTWVPTSAIGFNMGAEAVVGTYSLEDTLSGPGASPQLAVIAYPTPQIARTHLQSLQKEPGIQARRSGPIVVLLHGATGPTADQLLQNVNYDADVTMVPPTPVGLDALPGLILGIFMLCGLIIAISVVVGLLTGTLPVLLQRLLPERYRRKKKENLIRLHLQ